MEKDRKICTAVGCYIRTCSRHRCNLPKWYNIPIEWVDFEKDCTMVVSKDNFKNLVEDNLSEEYTGVQDNE